MTRTTIRKQGGAAIMTIPGAVMKSLEIDIGMKLDLSVEDGAFVARPEPRRVRRRYTLRELLRGATPDALRDLADETAWAREGDPVGREL